MKYLLSPVLALLLTTSAYAFVPSESLASTLDDKVGQIESIISRKGESFRAQVISLLENFLETRRSTLASSNKVEYVISYLIDGIQKNSKKPLTRDDFAQGYDGFSIVETSDQIVATVRNTGPLGQTNDNSFENLAGFIFGDNTSGTEIAMTSPVTRTQLDEYTYETAFIMPDGWTLQSLPTPNNERITIKTVQGSLKAVKRFSGRVTKDKVDTQRALFQQELTAADITRYGLPTLSQYDGPRVAASSRRNELWVELNEKEWVF